MYYDYAGGYLQTKGKIMSYNYNHNLKVFSRELRNNMTKEERHLWYDFFKLLPLTVKRQKVIGDYIVDFYISSHKIAIEIDGIQHKSRENEVSDAERDAYLESLGIQVLRYPNDAIRSEFNYVCSDILRHVGLTFSDVDFGKKT